VAFLEEPPEDIHMSWLDRLIDWHKTRDPEIPWVAVYDGQELALHLGDFPAEPLYTLVVDGTAELAVEDWPVTWTRMLVLRDERDGPDRRSLLAYTAPNGDFVLDGQDLGPTVEHLFGEGIREYEWTRTIEASDVPSLVELLQSSPGTDVQLALEAWLTSHAAADLEKLIEAGGLASTFWSRVGD
jgi:hypothetical protein